jgi:hypothetical protein
MKPQVMCAAAVFLVGVSPVFPASADTEARVPCGVLDQLRGSLDNDLSVGMAGVRTVITSPYISGGPQKRDAETNLALVSHGIHVLEDINGAANVPGLAPLLVHLDQASQDMTQAVEALFQLTGGGYEYGSVVTLAWPQPATWTVIDYADQKKNDVYTLVNSLQPTCTP